MSDSNKREELTIAARINAALSRFRKPLIIGGTLLIVGILAAVVAAQVVDGRTEEATRAVEEASASFEEWQAALPANTGAEDAELSDEMRATADDLRTRLAGIASRYNGTYGEQRSLELTGSLEWELENYAAAREAWLRLVEEFEDSYLAPIALMNAAAASEALAEVEQAAQLYQQVVDRGSDGNTEAPRALFNLGRVAEQGDDLDAALEYYNRLVEDYGSSTWTNLARNRIIQLTIEGVGSGG